MELARREKEEEASARQWAEQRGVELERRAREAEERGVCEVEAVERAKGVEVARVEAARREVEEANARCVDEARHARIAKTEVKEIMHTQSTSVQTKPYLVWRINPDVCHVVEQQRLSPLQLPLSAS